VEKVVRHSLGVSRKTPSSACRAAAERAGYPQVAEQVALRQTSESATHPEHSGQAALQQTEP
jgi:hypothetical protein